MTDPYSILGVTPGASDAEIKSAYRKLVKEHHPDTGGDGERFAQINAAYDNIKSADTRSEFQQSQTQQAHHAGFKFEDMFSQQFGRTPRNRDVSVTVYADLEDVYHCSSKTIGINLGNGSIREVEITIPKGATHDTKVRFAGFGDNTRPGQAGNLFVTFKINAHPEYKVSEYDLTKVLSISILEAMVGTERTIHTLDNRTLKLHIKPGTQSGTRLRIPDSGLAHRSNTKGNLYVEIHVTIPALTTEDLDKPLKDLI
jgi:curved DNA-binding protein